jgi:hypothetical protein
MTNGLYNKPSWLGSFVGLVTKTIQVPADFATYVTEKDVNGVEHKIVKSGTYISTPYKGLLLNDVDITAGASGAEALVVRGSYIDANLPSSAVAVASDLAAQGLYAFTYGDTTRPYGIILDYAKALVTVTGDMPAASKAKMEANQSKIENVSVIGNTINIAVDVASLEDFTSTNETQALLGNVNWVGILIHTNTSDITQLKYNGSALGSGDVADALQSGGVAGDIVLWIVADTVKATPKVITLSGENYVTQTITIKIVDMGV